ncbi:hypothetical protein H6P81_017640 [Aristolochia fimbriata]|uniref:HPP transmembrane region domain-containing protein n=1 Tax=Aristolochia fimbriata TaxID=158543 RepID=A0AAV7E061_ARIFI|nr:hypothetical protein H6P81_017640 [Aristolochia fimbriata]
MATPVCRCHHYITASPSSSSSSSFLPFSPLPRPGAVHYEFSKHSSSSSSRSSRRRIPPFLRNGSIRAFSGSSDAASPSPGWDFFKPVRGAPSPLLSDIIWPSAGAFAAMAVLGKLDQILATKGVFVTIAPLGAVSAVLFATPGSPAAQKYNMFVSQIGCSAIGVLAFTILGPGWLARSTALAASLAFMIYTRSIHPPAASLPLLFIDGPKLQGLSFWYAFFPGAAGCLILCLIQEIVCYLKENFKF